VPDPVHHQRFQARRFRLQTKILRLRQRRIAGLRADAALNFIELAAGIALLLRKLVKRVGDFAGAILLLLGLAAGFQQLAADLQDLLVQRIGGEVGWHLARLIAQIIELRAQRLEKFGEIIDNLLILARAQGRLFAPQARSAQTAGFDGFRLSGFCRLRLFQFLGSV
jgi:hypothetical protein